MGKIKFEIIYDMRNLGEKYPKFYGLGYHDYMCRESHLYIIPFNYVVWLAREIYFRLLETPKGIKEKAWTEGYQAGVEDTYKIREEDVEKRLYKKIKQDVVQELLHDYLDELTKIWVEDD